VAPELGHDENVPLLLDALDHIETLVAQRWDVFFEPSEDLFLAHEIPARR
jgi:hypothetical protein